MSAENPDSSGATPDYDLEGLFSASQESDNAALLEPLKSELERTASELREYVNSKEYNFAMQSKHRVGVNNPIYEEARRKTDAFHRRISNLRSRISELE